MAPNYSYIVNTKLAYSGAYILKRAISIHKRGTKTSQISNNMLQSKWISSSITLLLSNVYVTQLVNLKRWPCICAADTSHWMASLYSYELQHHPSRDAWGSHAESQVVPGASSFTRDSIGHTSEWRHGVSDVLHGVHGLEKRWRYVRPEVRLEGAAAGTGNLGEQARLPSRLHRLLRRSRKRLAVPLSVLQERRRWVEANVLRACASTALPLTGMPRWNGRCLLGVNVAIESILCVDFSLPIVW